MMRIDWMSKRHLEERMAHCAELCKNCETYYYHTIVGCPHADEYTWSHVEGNDFVTQSCKHFKDMRQKGERTMKVVISYLNSDGATMISKTVSGVKIGESITIDPIDPQINMAVAASSVTIQFNDSYLEKYFKELRDEAQRTLKRDFRAMRIDILDE